MLTLVDGGAESPKETWLRLLFVSDGLPVPRTQIEVFDGDYLVARLDMGWPEFMVAVEDGGDVARLRMLEAMGWIVIQVLADDCPVEWLARVEAALVARGCVVEIADAA